MGYTTLKAALDAVVKTNGQQQITGANLNGVMTTILQGVDIPNRANPADTSGMGYLVLDKTKTFAEQVTATNTIYEIRDSFDLGNSSFEIPANCALFFNGGSVNGGHLSLNGVLLSGDVKITCDIVSGSPAGNNEILVDWFGATGNGITDDSVHMLNAIKALKYNGANLVFGAGKTYLHGDGLSGDNGTGNSYVPESGNPLHPDANYPANIGRDITLRFLGYDHLTIEGNGASIVSNENNGICKHNAIFFFGACNDLVVKNLTIDAKNKERHTNSGRKFGDYSPGGSIATSYTQMRNHQWVDSVDSGYSLRGNCTIYSCNKVTFSNVTSINSMMDGFYLSSLVGYTSRQFMFKNCEGNNSLRLGLGIGASNDGVIDGSEFSYNGYYSDGTLIDASSNCSGISTELESEPVSSLGYITGILISSSLFVNNVEVGVGFSAGTRRCRAERCQFEVNGFSFRVISGLSQSPWKYAENNEVCDSIFHNAKIGLNQSGSVVKNNTLYFDKDFSATSVFGLTKSAFTKPVKIIGNRIETNLAGAASSFSNYVDLSGNIIIRENWLVNVARPSGTGVAMLGLEVCDNTIEVSDPAANTTTNLRADYTLLAGGTTSKLICTGNMAIGFTSTNLLNESFYISSNKIVRVLPFDNSGYSDERWYQLPLTSGIITIVSQRNYVYRIHVFYDNRTSRFRAVYYDGIAVSYTKEAEVYYKDNVAYLKIAAANYATITYEQLVRSTEIRYSNNFAMSVISAPDITGFTYMVNLCLTTDIDYSAIDAVLSGKSMFKDGKPHWWSGSAWVDGDGFPANKARKGATADRPSLAAADSGLTFYDSDLGKMILWNGSAWVNMDGSALA